MNERKWVGYQSEKDMEGLGNPVSLGFNKEEAIRIAKEKNMVLIMGCKNGADAEYIQIWERR